MKRINILSVETSNKIAAGEVIERPFSVVKELVENSIDAGSKNISIEIEEGGQKKITVLDDGSGIHPDDVEKAFLPHTTSKISNIDDIFCINSLGFRGEALASIAAVSKVSLKSRTSAFDAGKDVVVEGGYLQSVKDTGCNVGTQIEVMNLFYNVPARLKFMKSPSKETSSISDIINRLAICNHHIAFKFINNGKKVLQTFGTNNLSEVLRIIYGKSISDNLIYFENHTDTATVYGYVGNSEISRGSRNNQSIFVNKRYIKSKLITAAVENAAKSFLTINKFPFFVLFMDIYPEFVDVNIHPTKAEIKFKDDRELFKLVFDGVHKGIRESLKGKFDIEIEEFQYPEIEKQEVSLVKEDKDVLKNTINVELPLDLQSNNKERVNIESSVILNSKTEEKLPIPTPPLLINSVDEEGEHTKFPLINVIGTFHNTYIIGEYGEELYLIDQHAAHEKILFEKYKKEIELGKVLSQIMLAPLVLELSLDDYSIYVDNKDVFKIAGFDIDLFGDNIVRINEIPYILGKLDGKTLFLDIIDSLKNMGSGTTSEVKYNKIASAACKAAVKAKQKLSIEEINKLINDLRLADNPFNCPHGRPTIIKMSLYEIEKKFKRVQ